MLTWHLRRAAIFPHEELVSDDIAARWDLRMESISSTAWAATPLEQNTLVTLAGEPTGQAIARVLQKAVATAKAPSTNRALRVVVSTDAADFEEVRDMGGHTLFSTPRGFLKWGGAVEWRDFNTQKTPAEP